MKSEWRSDSGKGQDEVIPTVDRMRHQILPGLYVSILDLHISATFIPYIMSLAQRSPPTRTSTATLTQTQTTPTDTPPQTVLQLRAGPSTERRVVWTEETVDNEGLGKKKSKSESYSLAVLSPSHWTNVVATANHEQSAAFITSDEHLTNRLQMNLHRMNHLQKQTAALLEAVKTIVID